MMQSVLLANSAFNESTVQEWEQEILPCIHTKNLD